MSKRNVIYAAPEDREDLSKGVYLIALKGASTKNTPANRQRVLDHVMEQLDQGIPPFDRDSCFPNGLSEKDLIYIAQHKETTMSNPSPENLNVEQQDIIIAANEIIELAKLKVDLTKAYRTAQQYKALITKIVAVDGGHLSEEECQIIADKNFVKSIKGLAEAKVKVTEWYQNTSGKHELILNELSFVEEEVAEGLAESNGKVQTSQTKAIDDKQNVLEAVES